MIRKDVYDVALLSSIALDASQRPFNLGQAVFIQLSALVSEALERVSSLCNSLLDYFYRRTLQCFSLEYPNCEVFLELDSKLEQWEQQLPPQFQQYGSGDDTQTTAPLDAQDMMTFRQRYMLLTWYLYIRMKLHVASTTGLNRPPQQMALVNKSSQLCIMLAIRLINFQCDACDAAAANSETIGFTDSLLGTNWYFEGCYSLFEATVALMTTLTRYPWPEKSGEAHELVNRTLNLFHRFVQAERSSKRCKVARMAIEVLAALVKEHWWTVQLPVTLQDSQADHGLGESPTSSARFEPSQEMYELRNSPYPVPSDYWYPATVSSPVVYKPRHYGGPVDENAMV